MSLRLVPGGPCYDATFTGELAGSVNNTTPYQLPNIPCKMVRFRAPATNPYQVYIGPTSAVTIKQNTTNTTTGFPLVTVHPFRARLAQL